MKKSKYKGKFSALALKALFLESAGRQYVAELEPYGVTIEFLDEFAARIEVFMHLPSDEDERENANDYVIEKKQIRSELTEKLRYFGHHFLEVFGRESTAYLKMDIRNLNNLRENTLSATASMTAFRVRRCFAELSANGITAEAVAALDDCIGRYITALNAAEAAEDARISATAARVAAANAIFDSCMKICRAGKKAFRNNSAARHNFVMN